MVYPIFMDTSNVSIKFAPQMPMSGSGGIANNPLNPVSLTPKMQGELLKNKYAKLRNRSKNK